MKTNTLHLLPASLLVLMLLQSCQPSDTAETTFKHHPHDPFRETMVESQIFELNASQDNVTEGKHETLLVFPKGCFVNAEGKAVTGKVKVELAEAFSLSRMLLSNLTTTSDSALLETGGMIFLNVTGNGEQLYISKSNPVYIEIPAPHKVPGMMAYKGTRDATGNMNWTEPKTLEDFLVPIDFSLLDFLPKGFDDEVVISMPFAGRQKADRALADSLYYSLSVRDGKEWLGKMADVNLNEPNDNSTQSVGNQIDRDIAGEEAAYCGIDPAIIQAIRSEEFQKTFIATREFEKRLQTIFSTCRDDIIEIYIKNTDKNLWESDSLAAVALQGDALRREFLRFHQWKQTNVDGAGKYGALLRQYYEQRLSAVKSSLEVARDKAIRAHREKNEKAVKTLETYKELLRKREAYRMETYGFIWSETGWINIDRGIAPKNFEWGKLEVAVQNGKAFDRVHTYVVYQSIRSLYRLNTMEQEVFFTGEQTDRGMWMPKKQPATCIVIAYKDEEPYWAVNEFITGPGERLALTLSPTKYEDLNVALRAYDSYGQENNINEDLKNMALLAEDDKRRAVLRSELAVISRLRRIAYPCCAVVEKN